MTQRRTAQTQTAPKCACAGRMSVAADGPRSAPWPFRERHANQPKSSPFTCFEVVMSEHKKAAPGESAEAVAYKLLLHVLEVEGRPLTAEGASNPKLNRSVILDGYVDCLEAVRGQRQKRAAKTVPAAV